MPSRSDNFPWLIERLLGDAGARGVRFLGENGCHGCVGHPYNCNG